MYHFPPSQHYFHLQGEKCPSPMNRFLEAERHFSARLGIHLEKEGPSLLLRGSLYEFHRGFLL